MFGSAGCSRKSSIVYGKWPWNTASGKRACGCWSKPQGSSTTAPSCIGRPQNFESRSLWILMCLTNRVSAAGSISGIAWSSSTLSVSSRAGSRATSRGVLSRLPGARFHCWPSPRSIGSFTHVAVRAVEGLVPVKQRLHAVAARLDVAERLGRIAEDARVEKPGLAGLPAQDVDAEHLLAVRDVAVADLETRLGRVVGRDEQQQPPVERALRERLRIAHGDAQARRIGRAGGRGRAEAGGECRGDEGVRGAAHRLSSDRGRGRVYDSTRQASGGRS